VNVSVYSSGIVLWKRLELGGLFEMRLASSANVVESRRRGEGRSEKSAIKPDRSRFSQ